MFFIKPVYTARAHEQNVFEISGPCGTCAIVHGERARDVLAGLVQACRHDEADRGCRQSRTAKVLQALGAPRREASASTIMPTVTRMPRMHGFPPMTSGSEAQVSLAEEAPS